MSIILVADIFGLTPALIKVAETLNVSLIVDPYDGQFMDFRNESDAYFYFSKNVGLEKFLTKLEGVTASIEPDSILIGFSIGASAIWLLSDKTSARNIKGAICFYGAQIRHSQEIDPLFEIQLIFPKQETHFDVSALQSILSKKKKVKSKQVTYLHGFMNFYSTNYSEIGYKEHIQWLNKEIN